MTPEDPGDARARATRGALAIAPGVLLAGVAGGIAFPILPAVGMRVGLPLPLIGAILAANRIGRIVAGPAVGLAADRMGGRRLLLGGLVLQVGVMALYWLGVTTDHPGLFFLLGRALHGPGSACVFVAAQALALHAGGREHGGLAAGTVIAAMSVGLPLGLVAGGVLSARLGDAATFQASIVALCAATVAAFVLLPESAPPGHKKVSLRDELRALADRRLAAIGALNCGVSFSALGITLTTLVLLCDARGISIAGLTPKETASALMGWMVIVMGGVTLAASRLFHGPRAHARATAAAWAALVAGCVIIGRWPDAVGLSAGVSILGLGAGVVGAALIALVGELASAERRGAAVGWLQLTGDVGGFLGPLAGTTLLVRGVGTPYLVSAALLACLAPVAVWLVRRVGQGPGTEATSLPDLGGKSG